MKTSILVFLLIAGKLSAADWQTINADQFQAEMNAISAKVESAHSYSVDVRYSTFESGVTEMIHDQSAGYVKYMNNKYHSMAMGIQSIQNANERIVVDSVNRIIAITNPVSDSVKNYAPQLTSLLLKKAKSIRKRADHGYAEYQVDFTDQLTINSYLLKVDATGLIRQVDIRYSQKIKNNNGEEKNLMLRIAFENWKLNATFSAAEFSADHFVKSINGKYQATEPYAGYELSDQRIKY